MRKVLCLTRRHLMLFLRNPLNVLLSFASIFIIIGIYILFLRDFLLGAVRQQGVAEAFAAPFTDRFMLAGLLVVISTTTCFGMLIIAVQDTAQGIKRDFLVSPASPLQIALGYLTASTVISSFFSCTSALGCIIFLSVRDGYAPSLLLMVKILGTVAYSSGLNSMLLLCLSYPLKSTGTFATLANLYGTLIGFLAGAYLPCYFYPSWLRDILYYFPPAQMTSLLRQLFTRGMENVLGKGMPTGFLDSLHLAFGIRLVQGGEMVSLRAQWTLVLVAALFLLALLWALHLEKRGEAGKKLIKRTF